MTTMMVLALKGKELDGSVKTGLIIKSNEYCCGIINAFTGPLNEICPFQQEVLET